MKNYKIWLIVVLVLLVVNSAVLAIMWFHHKRPPMAREHAMPMQGGHMEPKDVLINALAFTPKQATLFDTMRTHHRAAVNKLNEENHKLRDSLFTNIKKPKADSAVINSIAKKISDNQAAIEKVTLYHFRELRSILTSGQQTKFDGLIAQVLQMMGQPGPPQGRPPMGGNGGPQPGGMGKMHHPQGPPQGMHPGEGKNREHMGPPPDGMPPPGDHRGHRPPPPDGRPPGPPGGPPPDGPPPGGGPAPNGPPPNGPPPGGPQPK